MFTESLLVHVHCGTNLRKTRCNAIVVCYLPLSADLTDVLSRSFENGMEKMMITGGCLSDCEEAIKLANTDGEKN